MRVYERGCIGIRQECLRSLHQAMQAGRKWNEAEKGCFRMDMLECPYMSICKKYGCPEIVPAFCVSDDVAYGNMHPRLVWGRTKTLGRGDDCCDFKLTVI